MKRAEYREARVTKTARELERPDALVVHDGVEVDVTAVSGFPKQRREARQCAIEHSFGTPVCRDCSHLSRELTNVTRKESLVFPVEIRGTQESFAVEECADSHFDSIDEIHQHERRNFIECPVVTGRAEYGDHVTRIIHLSDVVARRQPVGSAELEHIAPRRGLKKLDGSVERMKLTAVRSAETMIRKHALTECAVTLEPVAKRASSYDVESFTPQIILRPAGRCRFEHDDAIQPGISYPLKL